VERVVRTYALTCRAETKVRFAFDEDDPLLEASIAAARGCSYMVGPRDTLTGWTNKLAKRHRDAPYQGSFGDDHVPVTDGWDERLLEALEKMGGGYAYPNDLCRDDIPEAVVISTPVVAALGWFCQPSVTHWYNDNIWRDLGAAAGRLAYCRDVIVKHENPRVTGGPSDATYTDAGGKFAADLAAYQRWRLRDYTRDAATVRAALGAAGPGSAGGQAAGRVAGGGG
jgi:hypothetical protein